MIHSCITIGGDSENIFQNACMALKKILKVADND